MVSKPHCWAALVLLLAVAFLLSSPSATEAKSYHHDRRLNQATAVASSRAEAKGPGSTAVSNVNAGAVSTDGQPATAVSNGSSVAEPGQTVISQCDVFATNSQQYKECVGTPQSETANGTANPAAAAAAGVVSYEAAPTCTPPPSNATPDNSGRLWGYENGSSCAFRFPNGQPMYTENLTSSDGGSGGTGTMASTTFEATPPCPGSPTPTNSTTDSAGHLWGSSSNGTSCAYKDAEGNPLTLPGAGETGGAGGGGNKTANATAGAEAVSNGGTANASSSANSTAKHRRHNRHSTRLRRRHQ